MSGPIVYFRYVDALEQRLEKMEKLLTMVRKNVRHSERVIYVDARKVRAYTLLISITEVWKQNSSMYVSTVNTGQSI